MPTSLCPWHQPRPFALPVLGAGVDGEQQAATAAILKRLAAGPGVKALVLFGSRARGTASAESDLDLLLITREAQLEGQALQQAWWGYYQQLRDLPLPVDLVVMGWEEAERLAGSRWHAVSQAAREGVVLHATDQSRLGNLSPRGGGEPAQGPDRAGGDGPAAAQR